MLLQCSDRNKPDRVPIVGNIVQISVQRFFGLRELTERELGRSLEIIASRKQRKFVGDAAKSGVCRGILLLLDEFRATEVIGHKTIGGGPQNWVKDLVRGLKLTASYGNVGAPQKSEQLRGIDLQCLVEQMRRRVQITSAPQHFPLHLQGLDRAWFGRDHLVDQLVGLCGVFRIQELGESGLRAYRPGIQAYRLAQHRFGLDLIAQAARRGTERSPYPAFKNGGTITRPDQIEDVGKFILAK